MRVVVQLLWPSTIVMSRIYLKFVTAGDSAVGKTTLLTRYVRGTYPWDYIPLVFESWVDSRVVDETAVDIELWDVAGGEEYNRLRPLSYHMTDVFLLCFSADEPQSFANVKERWCPELGHHCPRTPILLVGTKEDLRDDPQVISHLATRGLSPITYQQGLECARDIGAVKYMECSALTNKGVQEVFLEAARAALRVRERVQNSGRCHLL